MIAITAKQMKKVDELAVGKFGITIDQMMELAGFHLATLTRSILSGTVKKKNVLGKNFYIVIPFSQFELGVTKSAVSVTKKKGPLPFSKAYVIKKAKIALYPKRDHLMRQAGRIGIELRQLMTADLVDLFYFIYNPTPPLSKEEIWKGRTPK